MSNQLLDDFKDYDGLADNQSSLQHIKQLKQQMHPHLNANETIEWIAQPKQGFLLRKNDGCLIPFSLVWGGFAIIWELFAILNQEIFFMIFGIPFVLLGLYIMFFRFIHDLINRKKTIYALSNHRLLLKKGDQIQSFFYQGIRKTKLIKYKKGRGSILLNEAVDQTNTGLNIPKLSLDQIEDAEQVYNLINKRIKK